MSRNAYMLQNAVKKSKAREPRTKFSMQLSSFHDYEPGLELST